MAVDQFNRYFGGNAEGALRNMVKRYGSKKGHEMFYAQVEQKRKNRKGDGLRKAMTKRKGADEARQTDKALAQGRVTGPRHA